MDTCLPSRLTPLLLVLFLGPGVGPVLAQEQEDNPPVPQTYDWHEDVPLPSETDWCTPVDSEATEEIRSWTTREEFMNPLVDYLPGDPTVTSPSEHFGYAMGKPGILHRLEELYGYYERLAEDSERVNLVTLDRTTEEGNDFKLLQIGDPENLDDLEDVKEGMNALADPRETSEEEAQELIEELPVIYMVYTGLHSAETAHPNMAVELAYRLAVAEHPQIQATLEDVVVFLAPVAEPDGLNRMVDWYRLHGEDVYDDQDGSIPRSPWWGAYAGHDNNRNALQLYLELSKQWLDVFLEWKHPISLDVHEAGSVVYHYFSTGTGPYNEYIDPLTIKEWQWMANFESNALERDGMPGVYVHDFYDGWWPGYLFWITNNRNAIGRFTETWGGMSGLPNTRVREAPASEITREWFRPNPGHEETHWSFRNQINYQQAGMLESLRWAAENRRAVLDQFWVKSNNSVERGREEAPHAYVVPEDQKRSADVAYMLNLIAKHGIEVHQAEAAADVGGVRVSEGDYVIRMDQPYRDFAHMLMDVQNYPDESEQVAYIRGGMAWTFPLMHNVEANEVNDPEIQDLAVRRLDEIEMAGQVSGGRNADWYVTHPEASSKSLKAAYELDGVEVEVAREALEVDGDRLPPGAWLVPGGDVSGERLDRWAADFGLEVQGIDDGRLEGVEREAMNLPRVALLHTWRETRDSGAVRYALDHLDIPYEMLAETALADEDLRDRFDVILFPEQGRPADGDQIFEGIDERHSPMPYQASEEHPSLGFPNETDDVTGGVGYNGLQSLSDFVNEGGTLVTLGSATTLPVDFSLTRDVSRFEPDELIIPGAIVKGEVVDPGDPLTFGYGDEIPLWHKFGPYLSAGGSEVAAPVRYPEEPDDLFMSGVVVEPGELSGGPALASHGVGEGHMVLFGFNPMHRYQPHGNFAMVWNAILYWDQL